MANQRIILAASKDSLARAEEASGQWQVSKLVEDMKINCIVKDSNHRERVYLGTQNNGILRSQDFGKTWENIGLKQITVKSLAVDPQDSRIIYAGCKPVSLFMTKDGGRSWSELVSMRAARKWWWFSPADPPGLTPYVSGLAVSPKDPNVILAGIEVGALMRSEDRGQTWSKHLQGAQRDCHSLIFNGINGDWAYEGGGGGVSFSQDGGSTWQKPKNGLGSKYGWMVAADPEKPDIWYLSASEMLNLLKGEFDPPAHKDGDAGAHIYRTIGGGPWEQLSGGLPEPLDYMAYGLVTDERKPGHIYAGLSNGDIWHSGDYGDNWHQMPLNLGRVHYGLIVI